MTDYILSGGMVYDGWGGPPRRADIAVTGDVITAIGDLSQETAGRIFSVEGLAVSPGFIDIHTHSDFTVLDNPGMGSSLAQGVTTELTGNCGISIGLATSDPVFAQEKKWTERGGNPVQWERLSEFLGHVEAAAPAVNFGSLAGHGTIRKAVMGFGENAPDAQELLRMSAMLDDAFEDGAFGLSSGLEYIPGSHAGHDELTALARRAAAAGAFYSTHMRNEGDFLVESVQEAIAVAEAANAPLQISHHKAEGHANWGKIAQTLALIEQSREAGFDVMADMYPYSAFMTGLSVILLPEWARHGSNTDLAARLIEPLTRSRILDEIHAKDWDWSAIQIGTARHHREAQGLTLATLGFRAGLSPAEAAIDLLAAEDGWVSAAHFAMSEDDIAAVMTDSLTMIGSDGVAQDPHGPQSGDKTHPRSFGTFPRVLGHYVRELGVITLSEAIQKMTTLPAKRMKLTDRGALEVGRKADITVFNPETVADRATFDEPNQYPTGIELVFVNGRLSVEGGVPTGVRAGAVLRR
ncbi:N-acyl-D-amino-acid deacylase [Capsulimonas corticalis]|uniref:N-acyl-D-amino-acid deacylase n=1 Tax=Capsulimonas corticalis TaxID=2219043 RepID=A0A402CXR8_9BACT|nr:D-aminoacylase [Capsulimonas corticalis]BDI32212.1 N-acyl-D-amino-acid deacylase [Capsulimonas corticalis]